MPTETAHPLHASRLSITAALAGCALFLVLVLFLREPPAVVKPDLTDVPESDQWKFTAEGRAKKLDETRSREQGQAASYAWIDQSKGLVRLPIDRAMELIVLETKPAAVESKPLVPEKKSRK